MKKQQTLFIVNPIAGVRKKDDVKSLIKKYLDHQLFDYEIKLTEYAGHGSEIASNNKNRYDIIVAVGGDGTINEIAKKLIYSNTSLGIIPLGSGNGLARHLKIPLTLPLAIKRLNNLNFQKIDVGTFNEIPFLCTAGLGFEADVSFTFSTQPSRGWTTYISSALKTIKYYTPLKASFAFDEQFLELDNTFTITFANASQYGNNAIISPNSIIDDGLIDICIIKKFPLWKSQLIGLKMFSGKIDQSIYYQSFKTKKVSITTEKSELNAHIDGDPLKLNSSNIKVGILPKSLIVLT